MSLGQQIHLFQGPLILRHSCRLAYLQSPLVVDFGQHLKFAPLFAPLQAASTAFASIVWHHKESGWRYEAHPGGFAALGTQVSKKLMCWHWTSLRLLTIVRMFFMCSCGTIRTPLTNRNLKSDKFSRRLSICWQASCRSSSASSASFYAFFCLKGVEVKSPICSTWLLFRFKRVEPSVSPKLLWHSLSLSFGKFERAVFGFSVRILSEALMVPSDFGLASEPTPQCAHQHVAERPSEIGKKTANPDQVLASLTHAKANTPAKINKMG